MAESIMMTLVAGSEGPFRIDSIRAHRGEPLLSAARLLVRPGGLTPLSADAGAVSWALAGATGAPRYTVRREQDALTSVQEGLGRPQASQAAFIGLRKSDAWWSLAADERRQ